MIKLIKNLFGMGPQTNFKELLSKGAVIIDVRTEGEFKGGHIKESKNIPLQLIENKTSILRKDQTIITCCASGMRSAQAARILKSHGFTNVYNGGGWLGLKSKIS